MTGDSPADTKSATMSGALSPLALGTVVSVSGTQWCSRGRQSRREPNTRRGASNRKCTTGVVTLPSALINVFPEANRTHDKAGRF